MLKRFLSAQDKLVSEAIDGLLRSSQGVHLARLDAGASINVVLRKHVPPNRVAVISGGGSGHEPAHAGFVGRGMLTAAVCGAVFASPGIDAILSAIIAVTGPAGCLLIVKNYTGDRLNFGIAAEQARALGYKISIIIVGDDIALGQNARARGIAGTILIHKIAGYHAEKGASLDEVMRHAEDASRKVRSLGIALTDCNVYDGNHQDRIGPHEAELGLGVHGESGPEKIPLASLDQLMHRVVGRFEAAMTPGDHIVMINSWARCRLWRRVRSPRALRKLRSGRKDEMGDRPGPDHDLSGYGRVFPVASPGGRGVCGRASCTGRTFFLARYGPRFPQ